MKSLEQRIIERAQNELRERIRVMVAALRNQLTQQEAETITHLIAVEGQDQVLHSVDQLLKVVEDVVFKVSERRYCDKVLDRTIATLEADLAHRTNTLMQGEPWSQPAAVQPFPPAYPNGK